MLTSVLNLKLKMIDKFYVEKITFDCFNVLNV